MHSRDGRRIDRVPHDYQRIVPDFRGDGIAFPSDQGLHILNRSSDNLTSAVGDMRNTMALSAILSPNEQGSRSLVVNLWDWNVGASWDDGATWAGWAKGEASPGSCGEGGGGQGMGRSRKAIMFHRNHFYNSSDGGRNWARGNLPAPMGAFVYVRQPGSRTEPAGACFALFSAPAGQVLRGRSRSSAGGAAGAPYRRCSAAMYLPTPSRSCFGRSTGPLYHACASSAARFAFSSAAAAAGSASLSCASAISASRLSKGLTRTLTPLMETAWVGRSSLSVLTASIRVSASKPPTTRPKTVCLPSRCAADLKVMKNWEPFVFGPAFAIETVKGRSCRSERWNSSSNSCPQIEVPPVPSPSGSPVWHMKPLMTLWKRTPS
mmetsp:Transcript_9058/g.29940  ORF Transcript_9058/g.29940 Transcript_9058/m.29940 type:complete len:377 (-) Transcript_9058:1508-2638(-)